MARYLYSELSTLVQARLECMKQVTSEWADKHEDVIERLVKDHMPSGSGFDSGTTLNFSTSHADKLSFVTHFHHMNEGGYYDGWTTHIVTVTPSLSHGFNLRISGRNRNDIKDMMYEMFRHALMTDVEWDIMRELPTVKALNLEIVYRWIDNSQGEHVVIHNNEVIYNGTQAAKESKTYANSWELCKAFCVSHARKLTQGLV